MRDWLPEDDLAHFVVEAVERVPMRSFHVNERGTGSAQYHPRMMLALLIYCYANGIFGSRRIERTTYHDIGVRYVASNTHPDHDTICAFRRKNSKAIAETFEQVLLLAKELKLLRVGTVSVDGTKVDANENKRNSIRYDRAQALREQLRAEIEELLERAESEDAQALPEELARREELKSKLDEACAELERRARTAAEAGVGCAGEQQRERPPGIGGGRGCDSERGWRAGPGAGGQRLRERQRGGTTRGTGRRSAGVHTSRRATPSARLPATGGAPAVRAEWIAAMRAKMALPEERARYRLRRQTVEPVFGIVKQAMGFRQFLLRGLDKVEWRANGPW